MKPLTILIIISTSLALSSFKGCKSKHGLVPAASCCVDFNNSSSFPLDTSYPHANDSVYYSCGFTVFTDSLYLNKGYYNFGRIENAKPVFGSGQIVNTNNITLKFTNISTIKPVTVTFDYLDMGGNENLSVNGNLYSGDLTAAPATLGGVTVSVTSTPIPLPARGHTGTVTLSGIIKEFNIGGQEFYLDNVCFN